MGDQKPCVEPPLLVYLESSLPPSKCTFEILVSWRQGMLSKAAGLGILSREGTHMMAGWLGGRSHLLHDVPSLVHGSQAAQNQLCGFSLSRTTLPTGRTQGQGVSSPLPLHVLFQPMSHVVAQRHPVLFLGLTVGVPICLQPEHSLAHLMMTHWFCLASSILAKARFAIAKRCLLRQATRRHCP